MRDGPEGTGDFAQRKVPYKRGLTGLTATPAHRRSET